MRVKNCWSLAQILRISGSKVVYSLKVLNSKAGACHNSLVKMLVRLMIASCMKLKVTSNQTARPFCYCYSEFSKLGVGGSEIYPYSESGKNLMF